MVRLPINVLWTGFQPALSRHCLLSVSINQLYKADISLIPEAYSIRMSPWSEMPRSTLRRP